MKELRIESRLRNNRLYNAIYSNYANMNDFCKITGSNNSTVGRLLNLKMLPINSNTFNYNASALKIANHFGVMPEYLFPMEIYSLPVKEVVRELSVVESLSYETKKLSYDDTSLLEDVNNENLKEDLIKAVKNSNSSERNKEIFFKRYGLNNYLPMTSKELAIEYNLCYQNIRGIIGKTSQKLRDNSKKNKLKQYLEI